MRLALVLAVAATTFLLAGAAQAACPRPKAPLSQRFDAADAAVVGRVIAVRAGRLEGEPERVLTIDVDQHVKGDLPKQVVVWSPSKTGCDVVSSGHEPIGLLLTRSPRGLWIATRASVVDPGLLLAEGGKPRGGIIKVGIGFVIVALVLLWALARLRKGKRPDLPGAPEP